MLVIEVFSLLNGVMQSAKNCLILDLILGWILGQVSTFNPALIVLIETTAPLPLILICKDDKN